MSTGTNHCLNCSESDDVYECKGCLQIYCYSHLTNHREEIEGNFNKLQDNSNLFRQNIYDEKNQINDCLLIQEINKWENESIEKIQLTASKYRDKIIHYINKYIIHIENNLNHLFEQSKQIRKENKMNEILLNQSIQKLEYLKKELDKPFQIFIKQESTSFINKIDIIFTSFGNV